MMEPPSLNEATIKAAIDHEKRRAYRAAETIAYCIVQGWLIDVARLGHDMPAEQDLVHLERLIVDTLVTTAYNQARAARLCAGS